MQPTQTILAELQEIYDKNPESPAPATSFVTSQHLDNWSKLLGYSRIEVFDHIGVQLAQGFHHGRLSYDFCDFIANSLFARTIDGVTASGEEIPPLFLEVYLAFDEGEYYHRGNRQEDPVATYTRPMIAKFLESLPPGR